MDFKKLILKNAIDDLSIVEQTGSKLVYFRAAPFNIFRLIPNQQHQGPEKKFLT